MIRRNASHSKQQNELSSRVNDCRSNVRAHASLSLFFSLCVRVVCVATGTCGKSKYGPEGFLGVGSQLPLTLPCEESSEFRWRMPFHDDDPCPKKTPDPRIVTFIPRLVLVRSLLPPVNYDEKQMKRPTFHVTKTSMTRFECRP